MKANSILTTIFERFAVRFFKHTESTAVLDKKVREERNTARDRLYDDSWGWRIK